MVTLKDVFKQLIRDVKSEKLRTFLTVFGIVWGTVAISLMLAFGTGLHKQLVKSTAGLGDRIVIAWPGLTSIPYEGLGKGRRIRITDEDLETTRGNVAGLKRISAEYSNSFRVSYATKTMSVDTSGVAAEFGPMRNLIPQEGGRFIDAIDIHELRRVAFLGDKLATDIFGSTSPVGKTILVNQSPFLVVGALIKKDQDSNYAGPDSGKMWIPLTTYKGLTGEKYVSNFVFQAAAASDTKSLLKRMSAALGKRLRFDAKDKEALSMWTRPG